MSSPPSHPWTGLPGPPPDLAEVRRRIAPFIRATPLVECAELAERTGVPVFLKLETHQETGSFKLRGAAAFLTALAPDEALRGVVACSSGNHGRAVAHMAARLGIPAVIVLPDWVDPVKVAGIRAAGAELVSGGPSYDDAEARALELAVERGALFVPPFDDPVILAGQGTVALEILDAIPGVQRVVAPLSGGGLVAGIGLALRDRAPRVEVCAVSARAARVMLASLAAGRPVALPEEPTLAGALAGGIGMENRWTLPLVDRVVDHHVEVSEAEIAAAMRFLHGQGITAEGGGAVGVAAVLAGRLAAGPGPMVVVVSGGNVAPDVLEEVLQGG
jgi:threonine dehydratase